MKAWQTGDYLENGTYLAVKWLEEKYKVAHFPDLTSILTDSELESLLSGLLPKPPFGDPDEIEPRPIPGPDPQPE